jgi:hypothetical protein
MSNPIRFQECHGSWRALDEEVWRGWQAKNRLHDERIAARLTKGVKWACIATLLVTAALPLYIAPYQEVPRLIVAAGAVMVVSQSLSAHRYAFAALFAAIGLLYNPIIPAFNLAGNWQVSIIYMTVILFAFSLAWIKVSRSALSILPNQSAR